ncbi:MAG: hypothetical protein LKF75_00150 [Bacilli bacterium]|jgi:hypothetical protein|nr:hypothetical protein [Bacilli bacterium]MCH4278384.1 hypothetical protein [Bacilli bacterium]
MNKKNLSLLAASTLAAVALGVVVTTPLMSNDNNVKLATDDSTTQTITFTPSDFDSGSSVTKNGNVFSFDGITSSDGVISLSTSGSLRSPSPDYFLDSSSDVSTGEGYSTIKLNDLNTNGGSVLLECQSASGAGTSAVIVSDSSEISIPSAFKYGLAIHNIGSNPITFSGVTLTYKCGVKTYTEVSTITELTNAITAGKKYIRLMKDIPASKAASSKYSIKTTDTSGVDFVFDLNGHAFKPTFSVASKYKNGDGEEAVEHAGVANIIVADLSGTSAGILGSEECFPGAMVTGANINIDMMNITCLGKYIGFSDNGSCQGGTVSAKNTRFIGVCDPDSNGYIEDAGAFLPAGNTRYFDNCTFTGGCGIYAKGGLIVCNNCTINGLGAVGAVKGNSGGFDPTGDAVAIDNHPSYVHSQSHAAFVASNCEIRSEKGYGVHFFTSQSGATNFQNEVNVDNCAFNTTEAKRTYAEGEGNSITVNNPSSPIVPVATREQLVSAINNYATDILLTADIQTQDGGTVATNKINVYPNADSDRSLSIDLNGHTIGDRISVYGSTYTLPGTTTPIAHHNDLFIKNASGTNKDIGSFTDSEDGLAIFGGNVYANVSNVDFKGRDYGFVTNGTTAQSGSILDARDCKFLTDDTVSAGTYGTAGAYLAADGVNIFYGSTFRGQSGVYAKSSHMSFTNCVINGLGSAAATPTYYGNGCNPTSSAVDLDCCNNGNGRYKRDDGVANPLKFTAKGTAFTSVSNFDVYQFLTNKTGTVATDYLESIKLTTCTFDKATEAASISVVTSTKLTNTTPTYAQA